MFRALQAEKLTKAARSAKTRNCPQALVTTNDYTLIGSNSNWFVGALSTWAGGHGKLPDLRAYQELQTHHVIGVLTEKFRPPPSPRFELHTGSQDMSGNDIEDGEGLAGHKAPLVAACSRLACLAGCACVQAWGAITGPEPGMFLSTTTMELSAINVVRFYGTLVRMKLIPASGPYHPLECSIQATAKANTKWPPLHSSYTHTNQTKCEGWLIVCQP
jgi:hypothetical protein